MKTVRFSKIKLLSDLFGQLISSAIILIVVNYIVSSDIIDKPASYIAFFTVSFMVLMMFLYIFFIFATPTMISIIFESDYLIFKYVKGYGEKKVFYKDIKWIKKAGFFGNRFTIGINEENIPTNSNVIQEI